jgi:uncharacterized YceG family protein
MSRKSDRSAAEREAARLDRARKRAEREGRPWPEDPVEAAPSPPPVDPAAAAPFDPDAPVEPAPFDSGAPGEPAPPFETGSPGEPEPSASFDADAAAADPVPPPPAAPYDPDAAAADPVPPPAVHEHDPQATQQWDVSVDWTDEHAAVPPPATASPADDPDATRAHEVPADDPDATGAHEVPADDPDATGAHEVPADDPFATGAHDVPAGEVPLGTRRVSRRERLPHVHRPTRGARREGGGRGRARVRRPGELGPPRRRTTLGGRIAGGVIVLLVIALGWFLISLFQPFGGGGEGSGRVVVRIPEGSDAGEIGTLLADRGVIDSGFFFNLRATIGGDRGDLKSGRYTLRDGMSYGAALTALTAAPAAAEAPPTVTVTIPEGRSRRETVPVARRAGLRGDYFTATRRSADLNPRRYGAPAGATLEGFLFPATYEVPARARVQRLVREQLRAFRQNFRTVDLRYARSRNLSAYDVLTIASMVEREVGVARERPMVAAVIYNRLSQGIPLGIDATLRFETSNWTRPLLQSTLDTDTPFNTRIRPGLPPGPIGSPGLDSIRAAARPARVDYTYYVVDPCTDGAHAFANTYDEHLANVARYDRAREAAGGDGLRCG